MLNDDPSTFCHPLPSRQPIFTLFGFSQISVLSTTCGRIITSPMTFRKCSDILRCVYELPPSLGRSRVCASPHSRPPREAHLRLSHIPYLIRAIRNVLHQYQATGIVSASIKRDGQMEEDRAGCASGDRGWLMRPAARPCFLLQHQDYGYRGSSSVTTQTTCSCRSISTPRNR
ncbi:hypothetical protein AB1N83_013709 [Pleurotus pulmonarius]